MQITSKEIKYEFQDASGKAYNTHIAPQAAAAVELLCH